MINKNSVTNQPYNYLKEVIHGVDTNIHVNIDMSKDSSQKKRLFINNELIEVFIVRTAVPTNIPLINIGRTNAHRILIADYISPQAKEILKENGVNYIDGAQNIYLKLNGLLINIEGNKNTAPTNLYRKRAFTKTGGMVVYQFLIDSDLVNAPQRQIAKQAKVSLGTVPKVIEELKNDGFLINTYGRKMELVDKERLLEKWIDVLDTKILPAQFMQNYSLAGGEVYQRYKNNIFDIDTVWGGEPGAALMTEHYLRPQDYTLFTSLTQQELIHKYKLIPNPNGEIKVYQKFWDENMHNPPNVHPILAYAQLMASRDDRNRETAQLIYNEYIQPNL